MMPQRTTAKVSIVGAKRHATRAITVKNDARAPPTTRTEGPGPSLALMPQQFLS